MAYILEKRMKPNKILNDAENLIIKHNKVLTIGTKLSKNFPNINLLELLNLEKKYKELNQYFRSLKKNIDMTSFLNICIKRKNLQLNVQKYHNFWHEIDTKKDIIIANKSKEFL